MPRALTRPTGTLPTRTAAMLTDTVTIVRAGEALPEDTQCLVDFTQTGLAQAQEAGFAGESSAVPVYFGPYADVALQDAFVHSGVLYRIVYLGPAGHGPVTDAAVRMAFARAERY